MSCVIDPHVRSLFQQDALRLRTALVGKDLSDKTKQKILERQQQMYLEMNNRIQSLPNKPRSHIDSLREVVKNPNISPKIKGFLLKKLSITDQRVRDAALGKGKIDTGTQTELPKIIPNPLILQKILNNRATGFANMRQRSSLIRPQKGAFFVSNPLLSGMIRV